MRQFFEIINDLTFTHLIGFTRYIILCLPQIMIYIIIPNILWYLLMAAKLIVTWLLLASRGRNAFCLYTNIRIIIDFNYEVATLHQRFVIFSIKPLVSLKEFIITFAIAIISLRWWVVLFYRFKEINSFHKAHSKDSNTQNIECKMLMNQFLFLNFLLMFH